MKKNFFKDLNLNATRFIESFNNFIIEYDNDYEKFSVLLKMNHLEIYKILKLTFLVLKNKMILIKI